MTTVVAVAKALCHEKALLLSSACEIFVNMYSGETIIDSISYVELYLETEDSTIRFTSRWLLNQLIIHLQKNLNFKCIRKKYGIILYKRDGDLLTSLSYALGGNAKPNNSFNNVSTTDTCLSDSELLVPSAKYINGLLHNEIARLSLHSTDSSELSVDQFLNSINDELIKFLTIATQNTR
jgi:hypothetical protein